MGIATAQDMGPNLKERFAKSNVWHGIRLAIYVILYAILGYVVRLTKMVIVIVLRDLRVAKGHIEVKENLGKTRMISHLLKTRLVLLGRSKMRRRIYKEQLC